MRATFRLFSGKSISSDLHLRRNLETFVYLQSIRQEFRICHSKFHATVRHRLKLHPVRNIYYNTEEEDGFQMVTVRAPPGAAESTAPGHIEWEKTIGSRVAIGEVVCRIRFKEDRTLDIKAPVVGVMAVRRKNEGDTVIHGDELFKIRLDTLEGSKLKKKKITKTKKKDYFEEEQEIVGRAVKDKGMKVAIPDLNSSNIAPTPTAESNVSENEMDKTKTEGVIVPPSAQGPKPPETPGSTGEPYKRDNLQPHISIIPNPYSQPIVAPIPQLMTTINEVNMEGTVNFINKFAGVYEVKYGNKPCLRSMCLKSAAHTLMLHKEFNTQLVNEERVELKDIEITIAIRHLKVEKQIAAGTYKTHKGERGFTLTPEWEIGSVVGTPVHSKTCTLGLHSIIKRPIFEENKIVAYPMMYASLTYDKKLIEDEKAVEFLNKFKELMEDPRHILVHSP